MHKPNKPLLKLPLADYLQKAKTHKTLVAGSLATFFAILGGTLLSVSYFKKPSIGEYCPLDLSVATPQFYMALKNPQSKEFNQTNAFVDAYVQSDYYKKASAQYQAYREQLGLLPRATNEAYSRASLSMPVAQVVNQSLANGIAGSNKEAILGICKKISVEFHPDYVGYGEYLKTVSEGSAEHKQLSANIKGLEYLMTPILPNASYLSERLSPEVLSNITGARFLDRFCTDYEITVTGKVADQKNNHKESVSQAIADIQNSALDPVTKKNAIEAIKSMPPPTMPDPNQPLLAPPAQ